MTAPNQGFPDNLDSLLGGGAYQIGGGSRNYGQGLDQQYVQDLIFGPLSGTSFDSLDGMDAGLNAVTSALALIPVDTLKLLKPFLPGATDADFADSTTAANFVKSVFVPNSITATTDWFSRLVTDLTVLLDLFHLTYEVGTTSDTKTTLGTNGKLTWYAAWADLLDLVGITTSTTPPTDPAPSIGGVVADHNDWFGRFIQDITVLLDLFHLTYEPGSPTDSITHTGTNGKLTWYAAWNNLMDLFGVVTSTSALTDPAPTIGSAVSAASNTIYDLSAALQEIQGGAGQSGESFQINFAQYPDGSWPSTDFPIAYTGSGTGFLTISGGKAVWHKVAGADRQVVGRYVNPTVSDYQVMTATIAGLPEGSAKNYACVRMNATGDTFVYAGVFVNWSTLTLDWELGHYISGVKQTPLATGSGAPLNFSFTLKAGVGGDPYRFQGISGSNIVFDFTDSSHHTSLGNYYFGFRSETASSGSNAPAPASFIGCRDDDPSGTVGTGIRQYRGSTTAVTQTAGKFSSGFFDTTDRSSSDMPNSGNAVTAGKDGWYDVEIRAIIDSVNISSGTVTVSPVAYINNNIDTVGPPTSMANIGGLQMVPESFGGTVKVYAKSGDVIEPGLTFGSGASGLGAFSTFKAKGEATGTLTRFTVALSSR